MLAALLSSIPPPAMTTKRARAAFTSCLSGRLLAMRFVLRRRSEPDLLQLRKCVPANERICGHVKGTVASYVERPCQSDQFARARDVQVAMGIEDALNHAVRPQVLGNHNVASHGIKLLHAVRKSPPPGRIVTRSPAELLDRINSITPALAETPLSSKLLHSSTPLAPRPWPKPSRCNLQSRSVRSYSSSTEPRARSRRQRLEIGRAS